MSDQPTKTPWTPAAPAPLVSVHNEWDPLEEIIVGTAVGACTPRGDIAYDFMASRGGQRPLPPVGLYPEQVIEQTQEDLEELVALLRQANVRVRRARAHEPMRVIRTPDWEATEFYAYCPRDILLAIGTTIIETPSFMRSRHFEALAYRHLLLEYLGSGARWISAPPPRLSEEHFDTTRGPEHFLPEVEPVFDAANVLRIGRDVLYLVSISGNKTGAAWLKSTLGPEYRVHLLEGLYTSVHVDSTIVPLRPGLVLLNPERVSPSQVPSIFAGWDVLYAPEMVEYAYSDLMPHSSKWLGINLLMITPSLAFVDSHQVPLMKLLSSHGIECVPIRLRHGRPLAGGVHCVTLDVRRRGILEDYRT
ncbi:MAG: inosamine-phosphate amidinotransferase 1 [Myxococcota bacterium]